MIRTVHVGHAVKRCVLPLAVAGFIAAGVSGCDTTPPTVNSSRQITVIGSAPIQGNPGTLITSAVTTITAGDATIAITQTNERQQIIINGLVDAGVNRKDITTLQPTLRPIYSPNEANVVVGYQSSSMLQVRAESDSVTQVAAVVSHMGGENTQITDISFTLDKNSPLVNTARGQAFNDARDHAEQYAELAGGQLGKILSISENTVGLDGFIGGDNTNRPLEQHPNPPGVSAPGVQIPPGSAAKHPLRVSVTTVWELH